MSTNLKESAALSSSGTEKWKHIVGRGSEIGSGFPQPLFETQQPECVESGSL